MDTLKKDTNSPTNPNSQARPMKIGIEAQRVFRPHKHGMDIVALELIRHLQKIDQYNEYFIFVKPDADPCLKSQDNFKVIEVNAKTYLDWEQISLPKAIKKSGIELMHFTSNTATLKCPVPTVITLHDVIFLEKRKAQGTMYQKLGHVYRRWNVPRAVRKAEKILTVSNYEKTQITNQLPNIANKVIVAHNGVAAKFKKLDQHKELIKGLQPKSFVFYLGNQAPKKNMGNALRGYAQYAQSVATPLPLVVAETSEEQLSEWLNSLNLHQIKDNILLTGYIPNANITLWYNQAKVFLYPSLRESFGLPILEAMACGTPVITSNTSAMPEVANGCGLLVDPQQPAEIAQAIERLAGDEALEKSLITKGLENAKNFTWEAHAQISLDTYREIVLKETTN